MKILVTGGAGYVGSHACKMLALRGFEPITFDNLSRGNRWAVKWGPLEIGDIANANRIRDVLRRYQPAAVMHFAAYAYVGESLEKPLLYYRNNVCGSAALLAAITDYRSIPVVFSSTCAVYGNSEQTPIGEDHPLQPISAYGVSKRAVERILADLDRANGLRSISLRYFNAAGADPEGEIGEAHDPEPHLIPRVLAAARDGACVTVYGDDYPTPDGTCIRDFVHVVDLADAHIRALDDLLAGGPSGVLNLANARGYSVMEVIQAAQRVCEKSLRFEIAPRRSGDPAMLVGSATRAYERLGWMPARAALEQQIEDAWRWMNESQAKRSSSSETVC
jgi:UDP-glucose-4-epimerase GalE